MHWHQTGDVCFYWPASTEDEVEDGESGAGNQANRRRPIFECFWNGRLIPYTTVSEYVPPEVCFQRYMAVVPLSTVVKTVVSWYLR